MPKKQRNLIVIGKLKTFDEAAWKRLLTAYAYHLHEQRTERIPGKTEDNNQRAASDEPEAGGRS